MSELNDQRLRTRVRNNLLHPDWPDGLIWIVVFEIIFLVWGFTQL